MKPLTILLFSLLFLASCGSVEKSVRRGDASMAIGEYAEAAGRYKKAYAQVPVKDKALRSAIAYKLGDAYRRYGNSSRALGAFSNAYRYGLKDSLTAFYLGELLRTKGDYSAAYQAYADYLTIYPSDDRARAGQQACLQAQSQKAQTSLYTVKVANQFNGSRSDYAPAYAYADPSHLYFTTTRSKVQGDISGITAMKPGDIYVASKDERGRWKNPEPVEGELNSPLDEGACQFSPDGKTMYFTLCREDATYPRMAEIWSSSRSDAKWGKPTQVKITSDSLSSYAHPAVSPDGKWLYFTSDMPGGLGGLDLWRVWISGDKGVGRLENLGPQINTPGNEMFPTFRPNGDFYFSSDGRDDGLGGLDLYRAKQDTVSKTWTVTHLPVPMNSSGDDFGMTFEGLHNRGYFSSNRHTGGRGWDKIYEFSYPEVLKQVKGWVYEQDGYELPSAVVYMVGSDGTNEKLSVLTDGSFEHQLTKGVSYLFLATCKGYMNVRGEIHTDTLDTEQTYVLQFPLPSMSVPVLIRNVFYEFDKADLTSSSAAALDRLALMLKENPNVTIELSAHCDYRGNDAYNLRLSQRRAESVVNYLTQKGIEKARLEAKGYGRQVPKIVNKKLTEQYDFLHEGDTLSVPYILKLPAEQQEICNALNRRTEFRVLRTTYGLFDEHGNLKPEALRKPDEEALEADQSINP